MHTAAACLPCFRRQLRHAASLAGATPDQMAAIIRDGEPLIESFDRDLSPPENAVALYALIAGLSNNPDPFATLTAESNRGALSLLPQLRELLSRSPDPLATAARLGIAGNIIDYGARQEFDVEKTIADCLRTTPAVDHFERLRQRLGRAGKILYLADNCGELVFDRLFIEQLGKPVTLAVKRHPIINDALAADAEACGLGAYCRIIDNGTGCPGTPLAACSPEFQREFRQADLIISKGQGNFETLSEIACPIFFLLLVKCEVVASHAAAIAGLPPDRLRVGDLLILGRD